MLTDALRAADPLQYERRDTQRRLATRHVVITAPAVGADRGRSRRQALAALAAAIVIATVSSFWWVNNGSNVMAAVRLEIRLAENNPAAGLRESTVAGTAHKIFLHAQPIIVNGDIAAAQVVEGSSPSHFNVAVTFSAAGRAKMQNATHGHIGRPLAILIDGEVVSAPIVRSVIGASATLSGDFSRAEAERLARGILGQ